MVLFLYIKNFFKLKFIAVTTVSKVTQVASVQFRNTSIFNIQVN